ncbi:hypothetical protein NMY22_g11196 [Coprinellus aureogranulatus]|nr:hypothetical protein NMY22_g11196 [Coprinellus aureogranulatus]
MITLSWLLPVPQSTVSGLRCALQSVDFDLRLPGDMEGGDRVDTSASPSSLLAANRPPSEIRVEGKQEVWSWYDALRSQAKPMLGVSQHVQRSSTVDAHPPVFLSARTTSYHPLHTVSSIRVECPSPRSH